MDHPRPPAFSDGLIAALPIALGYFPIAFAFGVSATGIGLSGTEAFALSLLIYAGAAQFLALVLISAGTALPIAAATLIAMNLRHLMYGPALMKQAGPQSDLRGAHLWGAGLTDEVFVVALGQAAGGRVLNGAFMGGLALGSYCAWLSGTALGAFVGGGAMASFPVIGAALGFVLPALVLALLLTIMARSQLAVIVVAAGVTIALTLLWSGTAGILGGMIAGALAGLPGKGAGDAR